MDVQPPAVMCWACSVLVGVPFVNSKPAEAFKCGWCGAINNLIHQQYHYPGRHQASVQLPVEQQCHQPRQQHPSLPHLSSQQQPNPQQKQQNSIYLSNAASDQQLSPSWEVYVQQQSQQQLEQQEAQQLQMLVPQQQTQLYLHQGQLHINNEGNWATQQLHRRLHHHSCGATAGVSTQSNSKSSNLLQVCRRCISFFWRWLIIAVVLGIISSVTGIGVFMLLPQLCTTHFTFLLNLAIAALLVFNIVFYYAASVLQSPGSVAVWVPLPTRGPEGEVLQGSFEHYTFCEHCQAPKPPSAHHCRTCGTCVVEMDHHCPFINNCVGRGNLRPFLLFLIWTLAASCYILVLCSILLYENRHILHRSSNGRLARPEPSQNESSYQKPPLLESSSSNWQNDGASTTKTGVSASREAATITPGVRPTTLDSSSWLASVTEVVVVFLQYAPGWLLAAYYLVAAAVALLLAVGMLLWSQLSYLSRGVTYIQHLKGDKGTGAPGQIQEQQLELGNGVSSVTSWQTKPTSGTSRRCDLLWARLCEVLGATCSSSWWPLAKILLLPKWRDPLITAGAAAGKKGS